MTFAFLFGGIFAVGVAVLLEYFDTSFRAVADVEDRLGLPVLGVIPFARDPLGERQGPNLYAFARNNPLRYFDYWGLFIGDYGNYCGAARECFDSTGRAGGQIGRSWQWPAPVENRNRRRNPALLTE